MRLTWWGHSSVLLEADGVAVVADPVLRSRAGLLRHVSPPPDRAWQRPDAVLISHLHHDHCDLPSLRGLGAPLVLVPPGSGSWLRGRGIQGVRELAPGDSARIGPGVRVTAVPAVHSGRREPWGPEAIATGHLLEGPRTTSWLAGDTALFEGMRELPAIASRNHIDLAVVPVWGWGPNLGPGHLDPHQAAEAVARARAEHAVAVHWGSLHPAGMRRAMRHHLRTPGDRFVAAVRTVAPTTTVHALNPGETLRI
ncbi:MBL fold metallo-hydrolase [Isoptericola sp. b441]|uniref:MBL fold metallo-hydrolase n=1 Tax=Actinotalea lenta TaxID=3064654 RepID=A0ABT9DAL5_9CELL|nr:MULTISPECIES: MBL fold metallo-hydrolase [unclassified Isoptericola]MDO8107541.1 MBL fold metallo-hydrolase [Isoptericola sp. b441]MDO8120799.1 MBL fold metallo-hydrolase [Isoptericola sp. b490]